MPDKQGIRAMATQRASLPSISVEGNLSRYLQEIRKFPMLEAQEEYVLAKAWREHGHVDSAHKLVTSHLRLVAKLEMGDRRYGRPTAVLISERQVGIIRPGKRFDPERRLRLAPYETGWSPAPLRDSILTPSLAVESRRN